MKGNQHLGEPGVKEKQSASLAEGFDLADLSKARTLLESMATTNEIGRAHV